MFTRGSGGSPSETGSNCEVARSAVCDVEVLEEAGAATVNQHRAKHAGWAGVVVVVELVVDVPHTLVGTGLEGRAGLERPVCGDQSVTLLPSLQRVDSERGQTAVPALEAEVDHAGDVLEHSGRHLVLRLGGRHGQELGVESTVLVEDDNRSLWELSQNAEVVVLEFRAGTVVKQERCALEDVIDLCRVLRIGDAVEFWWGEAVGAEALLAIPVLDLVYIELTQSEDVIEQGARLRLEDLRVLQHRRPAYGRLLQIVFFARLVDLTSGVNDHQPYRFTLVSGCDTGRRDGVTKTTGDCTYSLSDRSSASARTRVGAGLRAEVEVRNVVVVFRFIVRHVRELIHQVLVVFCVPVASVFILIEVVVEGS